jgi:hypothetical protein
MSTPTSALDIYQFIVNTVWPEANKKEELSEVLADVLSKVTEKFPTLTACQVHRAEGAIKALIVCNNQDVFDSYFLGKGEEDIFAEAIAAAMF